MEQLTYTYLASLAKTPPYDHDDLYGNDGVYGGSELGSEIGLHIHADTDGWDETEPERPVHFIYSRSKIVEVYPFGMIVHTWVDGDMFVDSDLRGWVNRLDAANHRITRWDVDSYRANPDLFKRERPEMFTAPSAKNPAVRTRGSDGRFIRDLP